MVGASKYGSRFLIFKSLKKLSILLILSLDILITKTFSLRGVPTSILIDKNGKEFARIMGSIDFNDQIFINWLKTYN